MRLGWWGGGGGHLKVCYMGNVLLYLLNSLSRGKSEIFKLKKLWHLHTGEKKTQPFRPAVVMSANSSKNIFHLLAAIGVKPSCHSIKGLDIHGSH